MKPHHTPGPWIADRNGMGDLAIFTKNGKHTLSCEGVKPLPLKQREANAELQAIAPDLFGIVRRVYDYMMEQDEEERPFWQEEIDEWGELLTRVGGKL